MEVAGLALRMIISLAVVIGLMTIAARMLSSRGVSGAHSAGQKQQIEILSRAALTRNASLVLARAAGRAMVLGVTDNSVTLLSTNLSVGSDVDLDSDGGLEADWTALPGGLESLGQPRRGFLGQLRELTVRR